MDTIKGTQSRRKGSIVLRLLTGNDQANRATVSDIHTTQQLTVRKDRALIGFHMLVSVQFDATPAFLDNLVRPVVIAGIEVYNSPASMPLQYNFGGECGVIVIWTRYGR